MNLTATKLKEAKHKTTHHLLPFIYYVTGKTTVRNIQNLGSSGGWMGRGWRSANPKRHGEILYQNPSSYTLKMGAFHGA